MLNFNSVSFLVLWSIFLHTFNAKQVPINGVRKLAKKHFEHTHHKDKSYLIYELFLH